MSSREVDEVSTLSTDSTVTRAQSTLENLKVNGDRGSTEEDDEDEYKPRVLLMGLKRSGKSSIANVVFRKMPPHETLYLGATQQIRKEEMHSFMDFLVWDLPGQIDFFDPTFDTVSIFSGVGAVIWVLDPKDSYNDAIIRLVDTVLHLQSTEPEIKYSVFIHKTDSLSDDVRDDVVSEVQQRISDDLLDAGLDNPPVTFYPTSIYDHSIFEAFSLVIQGLVPQLPYFEGLLTSLAANCRFEKVYIFDVLSKIYIASDAGMPDLATYGLCSDFIDVIVDLSELYGWDRGDVDAPETERSRDIMAQTAESFVSGFKGSSLYLKEINSYLALIGISREQRFEQEKAMVDFDVQVMIDSLLKVLKHKPQRPY